MFYIIRLSFSSVSNESICFLSFYWIFNDVYLALISFYFNLIFSFNRYSDSTYTHRERERFYNYFWFCFIVYFSFYNRMQNYFILKANIDILLYFILFISFHI